MKQRSAFHISIAVSVRNRDNYYILDLKNYKDKYLITNFWKFSKFTFKDN